MGENCVSVDIIEKRAKQKQIICSCTLKRKKLKNLVIFLLAFEKQKFNISTQIPSNMLSGPVFIIIWQQEITISVEKTHIFLDVYQCIIQILQFFFLKNHHHII